MYPELIVIIVLCLIVILFAITLRSSEYNQSKLNTRIRRMDMDAQENRIEDSYMRDNVSVLSQNMAILESRVNYLMRIQEAREHEAETEAGGKTRLKRKMDSEK